MRGNQPELIYVLIPSRVSFALAAVFAGRAATGHHRYLLYLACGRSAVVLGTKCRSVRAFQPVCRLDNFAALWHDSYYIDAFWTTIKFSTLVTVSGLIASLFFAALVDYVVRGSRLYQTLMLLPYAVAPAVAAVLWIFLFNPVARVDYPLPRGIWC